MIAGELRVFKGESSDTEYDESTLIELTDWGQPWFEIAVQVGKRRVYLMMRTSDLLREIKEQGKA